MAARGFLSHYLNGLSPYVRRYIAENKNMLSALLNETFPSFLVLLFLSVVYEPGVREVRGGGMVVQWFKRWD